MNKKKLILILFLALGALVLSACSGAGSTANWPGLSADGQRAYVAAGTHIYAVDIKTGKEVWRYPAQADSKLLFFAAPVLTPDGQLLAGSEGTNHYLVSINPETGKDNWSAPFIVVNGTWVASPLALSDKIYAPNTDGFVYVLDMNGKQVGGPIDIGGALWSAPSTDGTLIYVTSLDHHLHIIDTKNNTTSKPIDIGGAAPSSPAIGKDGAYIGSFASKVEFIQPDGKHETIADGKNWIWGTPALDGETLYYADLNGNVFSFDLAGKKQNWTSAFQNDSVVASMLVAGNQIYAATEAGNLVAFDKGSKIVWNKAVGGKIYTSPVSSGDLILVAPYQATFVLAAYDADGKQAWTFTPAK